MCTFAAGFSIFFKLLIQGVTNALEDGGVIKALCVPSGAKVYSNSALKKGDIYSQAMKSGAKGLHFVKVLEDGVIEGISPLVSSLDEVQRNQFLKLLGAGSGDLVLFAVGHPSSVNKTLDRLRVYIAHELQLIYPNDAEQRLEACIILSRPLTLMM